MMRWTTCSWSFHLLAMENGKITKVTLSFSDMKKAYSWIAARPIEANLL